MEKDILYNAIEEFCINSRLDLEVSKLYDEQVPGFHHDGMLCLKMNLTEFYFEFEVKKRLSLSKLSDIYIYQNNYKNTIIISDYIPKSVKDILKEKKISYLDTLGNAFITNKKDLFLYINTNKHTKHSSAKSNSAFFKAGLQVIYQILTNESIINMPYRHIAKVAKVSIDTVGRVLNELLRDKYLVQINAKELKLQNKKQLLQEWVTFFNKILRPKLKQRNFKPKTFLTDIKAPLASLGGELAGEYLSNYLVAEHAMIYTDESFVDTAKKLELIPNTDGSITLIEKFWVDENQNSEEKTVHPILVYADLLNNPIPRNLETAEIIYNKYVRDTL